MQSEPLSAIGIAGQPAQQEEEETHSYDFSECKRLKKLTTHE